MDTYWEATGELPFDLLPTASGRLLVSADNGVVYALDGDPVRTARIAQVPGRQLTRILPRGDRFLVTASNPGKILELAGTAAPTGSYTSEVKDATTGASWGLLRWEGTRPAGSTVAFATRSGNTSTPDETWADWVPVRDDEGVQRIASPPARYLQWKVDLAGAPVLDHVTLTYLPRNQRPRLTSLTIHPPGVVFQQPYATQEPPDLAGYLSTTPAPARDQAIAAATPTATAAPVGRRLYQKGFQTFQWEATDPDKDDLRYEVAVRRVGADDWRVLARELVGTVYAWDTSLLPDGRYVVRVIAADNRANPDATALQGERESGPLTIDNTPPTVQVSRRRDSGVERQPRVRGHRCSVDSRPGRRTPRQRTVATGVPGGRRTRRTCASASAFRWRRWVTGRSCCGPPTASATSRRWKCARRKRGSRATSRTGRAA